MNSIKTKPNQLKAQYDKEQKDISFAWGVGCDKTDALVIIEALYHLTDSNGQTAIEQLKDRGFDINTLKLAIDKLDKE